METERESTPRERRRWQAIVCVSFAALNTVVLASVWYSNGFEAFPLFAAQLGASIVLILAGIQPGQLSFGIGLVLACVAWPLIWVLAGYFRVIATDHAMAIAAVWWPLAIVVILGRRRPAKAPLLALTAVAAAAFPIATATVDATTAPSEVRLSVVSECRPPVETKVTAMYYLTYSDSSGRTNSGSIPWEQARVVGFNNGQALSALEWPSLVAEGDAIWSRFLGDEERTKLIFSRTPEAPVADALVTVMTLGQTRSNSWSGSVSIPCE